MQITVDTLSVILKEAFECGYYGSQDLRQQFFEEILDRHHVSEVVDRVYTPSELSNFPEGSIFNHSEWGRCWVIKKTNNKRAMQFEKQGVYDFSNDIWNKPMKLIYSSEGDLKPGRSVEPI